MSPLYAPGPVHSHLSLRRQSPRLGGRLERGLVQGHLSIAPLRATAAPPGGPSGAWALLELPRPGTAALEQLGAATRPAVPADPLAARPGGENGAAKDRMRALDGRARFLRAQAAQPQSRPRHVFTA